MGKPVVIGLAADSGCGKSTFMRRMTGIFGGESKLLDIGRETNTLVSDMTTVICLDDYHKWDRTGRKSNPEWPNGITALHADCQLWDKMAEDVTNLKNGVAVDKPIYNHVTGELDPDEHVEPTPIVIFEGLHPMYDDRVNEALDLTIYLDITDSVKFAWKAQRDMAERGASMEDVQAAIDARKPDFAAYVEPQKAKAQKFAGRQTQQNSPLLMALRLPPTMTSGLVSRLASSRWTARLMRSRSSSTLSRRSPARAPNSTASSLSRW